MNPYRRVKHAFGNAKRGIGLDGILFARERIRSAEVAVHEETILATRMERDLDDLEAVVWDLVEARLAARRGGGEIPARPDRST